ncbi:hypothetical protein E2R68_07855 [Psychromonas sp. RZ22]|uniref:NRDE family protein n=1 Tax=Psychromonas algarum TaxID=2555643 RepID=UPI001067DFAF|nr:NRDE family protein [Psychromonas sp. RZ22]TEW54607.1 hypothetical protein E2R68_07855 [Psychromonas sp. RZ22]
MCTLTYRLTEQGYQLFFNRDENKLRSQAIPPTVNSSLKAIYPIDPNGGGTWIAVHESGVSLALLNYYQAQVDPNLNIFTSRGVIIPRLLENVNNIHEYLMKMDFRHFQAFQLCVFANKLSAKQSKSELAWQYTWDGKKLTYVTLSAEYSLPLTSSGVDYENVYASRKQQFKKMITGQQTTTADYIAYHQHQGPSGKCSVKMYREDAQTVSFTMIDVDQKQPLGDKIKLQYIDYLTPQPNATLSLHL